MPDFKFIGFDLDGTLLNSKKEISARNSEALKCAYKKGYTLVILSGRHYREILQFLSSRQLNEVIKYIICSDGIFAYDKEGKMIISNRLLNKRDILYVIKKTNTNYIEAYQDINDFSITKSFKDYVFHTLKSFFLKRGNKYIFYPFLYFYHLEFEKLAIPNGILTEKSRKEMSNAYTIHTIRNGNKCQLDFLPKGTSKYNTLLQLHNKFMLCLDEFLYFGDDYNDEECFMNIKHCIVMGNAPESLKKYSMLPADNNDNDGVAKIIEELCLNY